MPDENEMPPRTEDGANLDGVQAGAEIQARVEQILAAFHGKTTTITEAGRENMRTVNRLARVIPLRHVRTDKTFRHNISRYRAERLDRDILIGARRAGSGLWTLVAELAPAETAATEPPPPG